MQLVAYGAQDIYLTGNPQITFFKVVYRRHTNFSMESIKQTFNGTADFGGDVSATISRNGDLVYRMYLEHDVLFTSAVAANTYINICSNYGSNLIKECELEIGGQRIDKQYSHWHSQPRVRHGLHGSCRSRSQFGKMLNVNRKSPLKLCNEAS